MAGRRCFSEKITESDPFYSLSNQAQALYLHLNMHTDDDGFVNNATSISKRVKGGAAALTELAKKRFLLKFGDVYVIKHWRVSNSLKNDRLKPLSYPEIAQKLWLKCNKAYTDHPVPGCITLYETKTGTKPPGNQNKDAIQPDSGGIPGGFQADSSGIPGGFPTEPNRTEPNRIEPNRIEPNGREAVFGEILEAYPQEKTGNTEDALTAFGQVVTCEEAAYQMLRNLRAWKQSEQWTKDGGKYIPYLSNWILRGSWRFAPPKMDKPVPSGATGELGEAELEAIRRVLREGDTENV